MPAARTWKQAKGAWALVFVLAITAHASGGTGRQGPSIELTSGIVVSREPPVVYVMAPEGAISAFRTDTGKRLWTSDSAGKPLLLVDDRLLIQKAGPAQPGLLLLAILNSRDGREFARIDVPLPSDVVATIDERVGYVFETRARIQGETVIVQWNATLRPGSGVAPLVGPARGVRKNGAIEIDMRGGRASAREAGTTDNGEAHPGAIGRLIEKGGLVASPYQVDGMWVAPIREKSHLVLKRWDAKGSPLPEVQLLEGDFAAIYPSADQRHLLVTRQGKPGADRWQKYSWTVYSMSDGRRLGTLRSHVAVSPFVVIGTTLVFPTQPYGRRVGQKWIAEPLSLHGFDLATGKERWRRAVRDSAYRGPRPPAP